MSRTLRIALCIVLSATMSISALVTDLTFKISGTSLEWPGGNTRNIYKISGRYIPSNMIGTRNQIYKDEAIVTFPRYKHGIPITLGIVNLSRKNYDGKPVIAPFPSWSLQEEGNCKALQNAVDIALDARDILWILDVGIVDTLEEKPIPRCHPKVVAINMKTSKVERIIDLKSFVSPKSRLQHLVVDYTTSGKVYLYISDAATRAIIVYNVSTKHGFRIVLPKDVTAGSEYPDVLYMSLVRKRFDTSVLYFTYLSSSHMFSIKVEHLRPNAANRSIVDVGPKRNKIVLLGTDNDNAIFFRKKGQSDIYMWNVDSTFTTDNFILVQQGNEYRLPTQVVSGGKRLLWVLESNFPDYIQNTVGCPGPSVLLHPLVKSAEYL